jgi:putative restriction endonuclease
MRAPAFSAAFFWRQAGVPGISASHVSDRPLEIHDGPFLELGLKGIAGKLIKLSRRNEYRPNRDRLAF